MKYSALGYYLAAHHMCADYVRPARAAPCVPVWTSVCRCVSVCALAEWLHVVRVTELRRPPGVRREDDDANDSLKSIDASKLDFFGVRWITLRAVLAADTSPGGIEIRPHETSKLLLCFGRSSLMGLL
eukprot:m.988027 g.988027  ORF g.988027 m.988027 type:complete len:128 (+) comp23991_c0_seq6:139-522(+)